MISLPGIERSEAWTARMAFGAKLQTAWAGVTALADEADQRSGLKDAGERFAFAGFFYELLRSAEAALALGEIEEGRTILKRIAGLHQNAELSLSPMQFVLSVSITTLFTPLEISIVPDGMSVHSHVAEPRHGFWPDMPLAHRLDLMNAAIPAIIASREPPARRISFEERRQQEGQKVQSGQARANVVERDIRSRLAYRYGESLFADMAIPVERRSLEAMMLQAYEDRIAFIRTDALHWEMGRPKAPVIDWPLLLMLVGRQRLLRHDPVEPRGPAAAFIVALAESFAGLSDR